MVSAVDVASACSRCHFGSDRSWCRACVWGSTRELVSEEGRWADNSSFVYAEVGFGCFDDWAGRKESLRRPYALFMAGRGSSSAYASEGMLATRSQEPIIAVTVVEVSSRVTLGNSSLSGRRRRSVSANSSFSILSGGDLGMT